MLVFLELMFYTHMFHNVIASTSLQFNLEITMGLISLQLLRIFQFRKEPLIRHINTYILTLLHVSIFFMKNASAVFVIFGNDIIAAAILNILKSVFFFNESIDMNY